jgi:hypothetical protein
MTTQRYETGRSTTPDRDYVQRRRWAETKPSFVTTELYAMVLAVAGTIYAGDSNHSWNDRWVWQVVAAIVIGYMVSRGLAKSGSVDRRDDD